MTQNVVNYLNVQETVRSNKAREGETSRHNKATETQAINELAETATHNRNTENIDISKLQEQHRTNVANEQLKRDANTETARSNRENERLKNLDIQAKQATNAIKQLEYELKSEIQHKQLDLSTKEVEKQIEKMTQEIEKSKTDQNVSRLVTLNTLLDDFLDRSMPADDVFGKIIKYFKK